MARGNPNIPLGVVQRDYSSPLLRLQEAKRQNTMDASNLKTAEQQQTLNQQTIDQNSETLKAAAIQKITMDTLASHDLLKAGNVKEAGALIVNNIDKMEELGLDTSRAKRFATLAATRPELAVKFMDEQIIPLIQKQAPELFNKPVNPNEITDQGQRITQDRAGNMRATTVEGFTPPAPEPVNKDLLQAVLPDGSIVPIKYDPRGSGLLTLDNQPYSLPQGATVTRTGAPGGDLANVLPPNREVDRRRQEGSVRSFNDAAGRAIELITQNPDANTFMANLATIGAGLTQEAGAVARFMGVPRETFDPSAYDSVFKDLNIDNSALQSVITSLAFQAAAAKDVRGSGVSNRDVERFIRQVGGNYSNPTSLLAALQETVRDVNSSYSNEYQSLYNKPFEGDLGMPQFPQLGAPEESDLTPEEQAELESLRAELLGR